MDVDSDGQTDVLLVAAPMFYQQGWEWGRVYVYSVTPQVPNITLQASLSTEDDEAKG